MVCQGFKAPDIIDPKLLDPKYALEQVEDENDQGGDKVTSLKKLLTQKRNRSGYETETNILYTETDLTEFILSADPHEYLSGFNKVSNIIILYSFFHYYFSSEWMSQQKR